MKTQPHFAAVLLLGLGLVAPLSQLLIAQNPAQTGTSTSLQGGVLVRNNGLFWVSGGKAGHLDATTVPPGQIMVSDGRLQALPAGIPGLPNGAAAASDADAGTAKDLSGLTLINDQVYLVVNGQASRLDPASIPAGQMINWEGKTAPAPSGLSFVGRVTPGSVTPGSVTPGTVTPGVVTPGSISVDGSVKGGDVKGGDVKGGDVKGGDVKGGDVKGGDVKGGDVKGGDVKGGDVKGGDVKGGDVKGGDVKGGDVKGGDVEGG